MSNLITAYTIIGHDRWLLEWCVANAQHRAGMAADWVVIHWVRPEYSAHQIDDIEESCKTLGARYVQYSAPPDDPKIDKTTKFLRDLYCCWNMGCQVADTRYVVRLGSDQFFSKRWLAELYRASMMVQDHGVFHTWTVESPVARHSRHEIMDFGSRFDEFTVAPFDQYADRMMFQYQSRNLLQAHECRLFYNHPKRGMQARPDGCTWLQTKELWERFGPMEDTINDEGVTGDVAYMDRIYDNRVPGYLCPTSVTYHLVRGESRDVQA